MKPEVKAFFDEATFTVSYVVKDPQSDSAAIIDSVLDYDPKSGRTDTTSADAIIAYAAAKAGLVGLTQVLAAEHGTEKIRVNALLPGGTMTPMAGEDAQFHEMVRGFHALKRMAEPSEIAQAALFLLSNQASFVTGSAMIADGGNSISKL